MSHLAHVTRRRNAAEAHTKSQNEPACKEHAPIDRRRLDAGSYNDDQSADEHAHATPPVVVNRSRKKDGRYGADIVDGKDDASARSRGFPSRVRDGGALDIRLRTC